MVGLYDLSKEKAASRSTSENQQPRTSTTSRNPRLPPLAPTVVTTKPSTTSSSSPIVSDSEEEESVASRGSSHQFSASQSAVTTASLDAGQIDRDVARCTWHLLTGSQRAQRLQMELTKQKNKRVTRLIRRKQQRLANLINMTLVKSYGDNDMIENNDVMRYYQGYHDVACIMLSTLGGTSTAAASSEGRNRRRGGDDLMLASNVLFQISKSHLKDCLKSNFLQLQTALRLTLFPLLAKLDREVHDRLYDCEMEPYFCLSWIITWFSHEIRDTELVKRLFDVFLVSHPLFPIYLSVAMIIHPYNKREIMECECDFALLHQTLSGLPKNSSMAGWKFQPGNGYVTDEEHDDGTVSTGAGTMDQSMEEATDLFLVERSIQDDGDANSLVSTTLSSIEPAARVSFQELIDDALELLRRVPPRKLVGLASRYYGAEQVKEWLDSPSPEDQIQMLQDPPSWAVTLSTKAEWVLRQERRRKMGLDSRSSRRERRNDRKRQRSRSSSRSRELQSLMSATKKGSPQSEEDRIQQYLRENAKSRAVIACGLGSGDDEERRRRKRMRTAMAGTVAVAVVAVAIGVAMHYGSTSPTSPPAVDISPPMPIVEPKSETKQRREVVALHSPIEEPLVRPTTIAQLDAGEKESFDGVALAPKESGPRVILNAAFLGSKGERSSKGSKMPSRVAPAPKKTPYSNAEPPGPSTVPPPPSPALPTLRRAFTYELLSPTWNVDANRYGVAVSVIETSTRHEAEIVGSQAKRFFDNEIRPRFEAVSASVAVQVSNLAHSKLGSHLTAWTDHSSERLELLRKSYLEKGFRALVPQGAQMEQEAETLDNERPLALARENVSRTWSRLGSAATAATVRTARGLKSQVAGLQNKICPIFLKLGATVQELWDSNEGLRIRRLVHKVRSNPIIQRTIETSFTVVLDASLLRFYPH